MYAPVVSRFVTYRVQLDAVYKKYANKAVFALPAMQQWLNAASDEQETISGYEFSA